MLERVAVPAEHLPKALASLINREHVLEAVVLSTCNRVEVYAHVPRYHGGMADLRNFFAEWAGMAPEDFCDHTYDYYDERAAEHLFAVASGLDSMVVGERQIHLQVKAAFRDAEAQASTGRVLSSLFRQALQVGKRTRVETGIADGAASMVDVGLDAAARVFADPGHADGHADRGPSQGLGPRRAALAGRTVLVVGAGKMGGMAAARVAGDAGRILIANRSAEKGERLALRVDGDVLDFGDLHAGLRAADLVLCSTGSPVPVIDQDAVADAMKQRPDRPLVLVDLAVPRDIDPGCSFVPGVTVLDIDAVRELTDVTETGTEVAKARAVVVDEARRFAAWTRAVRVEPTIAALRTHAEVVRQAELQRVAGRLGDLDERQRAAVEALTTRIVNSLLHEPSVRLKAVADARGGDLYAATLRELFDLPE
jgi:glutamyl-tRNA reductase